MNLVTLDEELKSDETLEFYSIIEELINNKTVLEMQNFIQHCNTSCYQHCLNVSYYSYKICKKLNLDYKSAARARNVARPVFI